MANSKLKGIIDLTNLYTPKLKNVNDLTRIARKKVVEYKIGYWTKRSFCDPSTKDRQYSAEMAEHYKGLWRINEPKWKAMKKAKKATKAWKKMRRAKRKIEKKLNQGQQIIQDSYNTLKSNENNTLKVLKKDYQSKKD